MRQPNFFQEMFALRARRPRDSRRGLPRANSKGRSYCQPSSIRRHPSVRMQVTLGIIFLKASWIRP